MVQQLLTPKEKKSALRSRIEAIKNKLPKNYRSIIISKYPQYDSYSGTSLINNVMNLKSTDEALTEILEKIAAGS